MFRRQRKWMSLMPLCVRVAWFGCALQLSCIPWVSKFFLFLDVAVCVKVSMELPLVQLVDLVLLRNKRINSGQRVVPRCEEMNTPALSQLPPHTAFGTAHCQCCHINRNYIRSALLERGSVWMELLCIKSLIPLGNIWQPGSTGPRGAGSCSRGIHSDKLGANMDQGGRKWVILFSILVKLQKQPNTNIFWFPFNTVCQPS